MAVWKTDVSSAAEPGWFDLEFDKALCDLEPSSSLGATSLKAYGSTIREFLGGVRSAEIDTTNPERVAILRQAVLIRLLDPESADPIRVFIKQEPHKRAKLQDGRLRLICAVSIVDTMVDRVCLGWLARAALSSVGKTPIMVGWSPIGGGYRLMSSIFGARHTRGLDMTAWDWTVPGWMLHALRQVIEELALLAPEWLIQWLRLRWEALFRDAVFQFGDQSVVRQPGWGVMKSGCYLTILLNSMGQVLLQHLAEIELGLPRLDYVVMGDDKTIESFDDFSAFENYIRLLGFLLKDSEITSDIHFAGFVMNAKAAWPEYTLKHVYLVTNAPLLTMADRLAGYLLLYVHVDEMYDWLLKILVHLNPQKVLPRGHNRALFEGY